MHFFVAITTFWRQTYNQVRLQLWNEKQKSKHTHKKEFKKKTVILKRFLSEKKYFLIYLFLLWLCLIIFFTPSEMPKPILL